MDETRPPLSSLLKGRTVLLTGSTGFLAKAFLEKLLRTVPEIRHIYLLVRASDLKQRLDRGETEIFSSSIFDLLKTSSEFNFSELVRNKIRIISGDTSLPRLGLESQDYLKLAASVDLVVNAAASTDFMNRLDAAVTTNALSAHHLAEFIKDSKHARLLHVSTCYVNEFRPSLVEEKLYPQPASARRQLPKFDDGSIDTSSLLDELQKRVDAIHSKYHHNPKVLENQLKQAGWKIAQAYGWNNIYTFTKWFGENLLAQASKKIHCSIVRPSIVESCLLPPHEGWIEGWKVADPIFYAVGTAKIKFFPVHVDGLLDIIPVDLVANAMFTAIPELMMRENPGFEIYQACTSFENPLRLGDVKRIILESFAVDEATHPLYLVPPSLWKTFSALTHLPLLSSFLQTRPIGKFLQFAEIYLPYTDLRCVFENNKLLKLHSHLSPEDQVQYPVSAKNIQWDHYLGKIHIGGMFKYLLKTEMPQRQLKAAS